MPVRPTHDEDGKITTASRSGEAITEGKRVEASSRTPPDDSQQRQAEISALLKSARAVLEYTQFDQTARSIFDACKDLIGASAGYVALMSKTGGEDG